MYSQIWVIWINKGVEHSKILLDLVFNKFAWHWMGNLEGKIEAWILLKIWNMDEYMLNNLNE